jgi:hypothetical protein
MGIKSEWLDNLFNQLFPLRMVKQTNIKTPLAYEMVALLTMELSANLAHENKIWRMLCMRDLLMLYLGFYCLLR